MIDASNMKDAITLEEEEDDILDYDVENESMDGDESNGEEPISLAKDETKVVAIFRIVLLILLIAAALAVSLTAFTNARRGEQEEFENTFKGHSSKIIDTFESEAENKRTSIVQLSRDLTSHALFANSTWPFVTLPDFEVRAETTVRLAEVVALFVLPIVTGENLQAWQSYTVDNQAWYWEGMAIQERVHGVNATTSGYEPFDDNPSGLYVDGDVVQFSEDGPNGEIKEVRPGDPGPFMPAWQYSPQIPVNVINSDFLSMPDSKAELHSFLVDSKRRNVAGPSFDFGVGTGGSVFLNLLLERWSGERGKETQQYEGGPLAYYYLPIYDRFAGREAELVGVIMCFIYWQTYFENLLPETASQIHVVMENTCNQTFTYGIRGEKATFLGYGDLHDSRYDYLEADTDYGAFLQRRPDDRGGCFYKLRLYPTQEMEDYYLTNQPLIVCLSVMAVFIFTTLTFVIYDRCVERRQRIVLKTATESSNVVNNLFPEEVRDRLYESGDNKKNRNSSTTAKRECQFLAVADKRISANASTDVSSTTTDHLQGASPIADEYPNCTVFFGDLAGFTQWSSTRTPSEVFLLLETLYASFDRVAKKLSVFKIETIGDCYVAVTGLPKAQDQHAIIMSKFASLLILKMNQLVNSENLLLTLGDDTCNLALRIGLHSGAVTAGILRGSKQRFQLFGDTVNTAARMESNGQKGKIQVSQATADILVASGKDKWLTPRKDLVEAKGKGKMQTFWLNVGDPSSMRSSVTSSSSVSLDSPPHRDHHHDSSILLLDTSFAPPQADVEQPEHESAFHDDDAQSC